MPLNPAAGMISSRLGTCLAMAARIFSRRQGLLPSQGLRALNRKADTYSSNQQENCASREAAHRISDAELILFERSGHYPFMEEPQAFGSAVGICRRERARRGKRIDEHSVKRRCRVGLPSSSWRCCMVSPAP